MYFNLLPLVSSILVQDQYLNDLYQSIIVKQLIDMGVKGIAPSLVLRQLPLAGRIAHFSRNWEVLTKDAWVLKAVKGYEIDLVSMPYQCLLPKELSFGEEELAALNAEIDKMEQKGAISIADKSSPGFYFQLFVIPKKDGGHKPVINLKELNQFVKPQHFKMESINVLTDILKRGDYMTRPPGIPFLGLLNSVSK